MPDLPPYRMCPMMIGGRSTPPYTRHCTGSLAVSRKGFRMNFALADGTRRTLMRVAAMLCIFAVLTLPMIDSASWRVRAAEASQAPAFVVPSLPAETAYPEIVLKRDPFAPNGAFEPASRASDAGGALVRGIITGL